MVVAAGDRGIARKAQACRSYRGRTQDQLASPELEVGLESIGCRSQPYLCVRVLRSPMVPLPIPYHCMVDQLREIEQHPEAPPFLTQEGTAPSKTGWADTFQWLAEQLGLEAREISSQGNSKATRPELQAHCTTPSYDTGGTMASAAVRTLGIEVFLHYVRDAPVCQLDKLALETSVHISVNSKSTT